MYEYSEECTQCAHKAVPGVRYMFVPEKKQTYMYEYSEECTRCAQKVYAVGASTVVRVLVILIYQYSLYTLYRLVQLCSVPDVHKKVCTKSVPYIPGGCK